MEDNLLDLDALLPEPRTIKFGKGDQQKTIEVRQPSTEELIKLLGMAKRAEGLDNKDAEQSLKLIQELEIMVVDHIPELKDYPLNATQILKLLTMLIDMAMPAKTDELSKKNVTVESVKKAQ